MIRHRLTRAWVVSGMLVFTGAGCAKGGPPAPPTDAPAQRSELTAEECQAAGGTVVGDIGDGAIHRPDYECPGSGAAPLGTIKAAPDGPIAVEGSVCCPG